METQTFMFFGIPGSGKGTQIELLVQYLKEKNIASDILHTSTGVEFRKVIAGGSLTGAIVKETLEKGFLQPDFLTTSLLTNILISGMKKDTWLVADGYPRTVAQSENFETMMKFYGRNKVKIVYVKLSEEEGIKRNLLRGRKDDTKEGLAKRLEEEVNNVLPAMNYFKDKTGYEIFTINGDQTREEVYKEIINKLGFS